jgi:hypothetical protein
MTRLRLQPSSPPEVGSWLETGWNHEHMYARARIVAVALDEPYKGYWVAIGRVWQPRSRAYRYLVITAIEREYLWRPSPPKRR